MRAHVRRLAIVTAVVVALSLGIPAGAVPAGGTFPISWLVSMVAQRPSWAVAAAFAGLPMQPHGPDRDMSGYVPAGATRADGGSGRAPHKLARGLDGYLPH